MADQHCNCLEGREERHKELPLEWGAVIVIKGLLELSQRHIFIFCWGTRRGY
jgi:hypothetical protein